MSITAAKLQVEFGSSGVDAVKNDITGLSNSLEGIGQKFTAVGQKMTMFVTAPIVAGLGASYMQAAGLEQAIGKVDAVYGDLSQSVMDWSRNSSTAFGMSQKDALSMVGTYGQIMQAQGMTMDQSAEYSQTLIGLSADMSAFSDRDITESSNAIRAALTGEYESLKSFGIVLKAADVEQEALNLSIADGSGEVTEAHRVQARYNLVMKQTTQMQGQFEREAKGASGQLAIFRANMADLGANIGAVLLPVGTKITQMLNDMLQAFMKLPSGVTTTIVVIAALAAAIGPLLMVLGTMMTGLAALPAIVAGASAAFAALSGFLIPLLPLLAAVGLAIAAYKTNFLGFGDLVDGVVGKLGEFGNMLFGLPESKGIGITLDTDLTGEEDAWNNWTKMPDGTWKHATLDITTQGLDGNVEEILDPATGEKSYLLHVDVDGDGAADATKIIDSVNQGGGKFVMTVEIDGQKYEAWYDEKTGETIIVPMEVEITNEGEVNGKLDKWKNRREKFEIVVKVINLDLMDRLQDKSNAALAKIQELSDAFNGWITDTGAFKWVVDRFEDIKRGIDAAIVVAGIFQDIIGGSASDRNNDTSPDRDGEIGSPPAGNPNPGSAPAPDVADWGIKFDTKGAGTAMRTYLDGIVAANRTAWNTIIADTSTGATTSQTKGTGEFGLMNVGVSNAVAAMGGTVGSQMGSLAANVTAQSAAAKANATSQFSAMNTSSVAQVLGMRTNAAVQMALMASSATTQGQATMSNMVGALAGGMAKVAWTLMGVVSAINSVGGTAASTAYSIGANISSSFASGMYAYLGQISAAAAAMVNAASNALKAKAMISSPSKLFRQYGEYVGEGFEQGITNSLPGIHRATDAMIGAPSGAFLPSSGMGAGGGTVVVNHIYQVVPERLVSLMHDAKRGAAAANYLTQPDSFAQYGGGN